MGGQRPTVLIVEDEADPAELFESALAEQYDVSCASNGSEALSKLDASVDVVVLDRRMPDLSGDQTLDEITARGLDCRVVMVTAVDPDFDVIDMGFDDYLTKPVDPAVLVSRIERLLALDDYENKYQELSAKLVTRNILEAEKSAPELAKSERFDALQQRIAQLEADLAELRDDSEFDDRLLPS